MVEFSRCIGYLGFVQKPGIENPSRVSTAGVEKRVAFFWGDQLLFSLGIGGIGVNGRRLPSSLSTCTLS